MKILWFTVVVVVVVVDAIKLIVCKSVFNLSHCCSPVQLLGSWKWKGGNFWHKFFWAL